MQPESASQSDHTLALLGAVSELSKLSALLWPFVVLGIVFYFRIPVHKILEAVPRLMDRADSVEVGGLKANLRKVVDEVATNPDAGGTVTPKQIAAAVELQANALEIGESRLMENMDALATEYDVTRSAMPPGRERTLAMNQIIAKMRALAPAVSRHVDNFKNDNKSAGHRLAAIAIMQMLTNAVDIDWLVERFSRENPFVFYQASLVLDRCAKSGDAEIRARVQNAARRAVEALQKFRGEPDRNTMSVLNGILRADVRAQ